MLEEFKEESINQSEKSHTPRTVEEDDFFPILE